ncbi:MAG: hypothetical protein ACOC4J_04645, partial [Bacteroidota bacterium]
LVFEEQKGNDITDDFLQFYKSKGIDSKKLQDGDYYHFIIRDENIFFNISGNEIPGFVLDSEKNLDFLVELFREFLDDSDYENLQIRLFSSNGDRFLM